MLMLCLFLLLAGTWYALSHEPDVARIALLRSAASADLLSRARRALVAHALNYYERKPGRFGVLPCPDLTAGGLLPEGTASGVCGARHVSSLGRLPWRTLGIDPLRDAAGECLWYAVSGSFKANPVAHMLNQDTGGSFQVYALGNETALIGGRPVDRAAAVIIAPGPALPGQDRSLQAGAEICGGNYRAAAYLEGSSAGMVPPGILNHSLRSVPDAVEDWISAELYTPELNDRVAYLPAREIFRAIRRRVDFAARLYDHGAPGNLLRQVAECLAEYGRSHAAADVFSLPWPAPVHLSDPRRNTEYNDRPQAGNALFGRVPDIVDDSNARLGRHAPDKAITGCGGFIQSNSELRRLWNHWKDHLFYAVADAYQPRPAGWPTPSCSGGRRCITLNHAYPDNAGRSYAAVLWFAGAALPAQDRSSGQVRAYLESDQPYRYQDTAADDTRSYPSRALAADFNDVLYCLLPVEEGGGSALSVIPCPTN